MCPVSTDDFILLGKIIRPHGLKGLLRVRSYADSENSLIPAETLFLKTEEGRWHEYAVISSNRHKNYFVVALEGIDSRDKAEEYRGVEFYIKRETVSRDEDEYFWDELVGLSVYLENGKILGRIARIVATGSNDIFVVKEGLKEYYIPAIHDVVKEIDLKKGRMTIFAMEGLLDLNEV